MCSTLYSSEYAEETTAVGRKGQSEKEYQKTLVCKESKPEFHFPVKTNEKEELGRSWCL